MDEAQLAQIPRYRSHKEVHALEIIQVDADQMHLVPAGGFPVIPVTQEWLDRFRPHAGGFWIHYSDGYTSFSPKRAFEEGYRLIESLIVEPAAEGTVNG